MDEYEYPDLEREIEEEYEATAKGCGVLGCLSFALIAFFIISIIILIF
jgi:hypothetical protein